MRRYYEILGVRPDATQDDIKEAWIFCLKAFHPDKFAGSSQRQQAVAQEALWRNLSLPQRDLPDPGNQALQTPKPGCPPQIAASSSIKAVNLSSAQTIKRRLSPRCASAMKIVRRLESTAETQPQLQPALLRLSAMTSQNSTLIELCRF
jgi:hypothetical protein